MHETTDYRDINMIEFEQDDGTKVGYQLQGYTWYSETEMDLYLAGNYTVYISASETTVTAPERRALFNDERKSLNILAEGGRLPPSSRYLALHGDLDAVLDPGFEEYRSWITNQRNSYRQLSLHSATKRLDKRTPLMKKIDILQYLLYFVVQLCVSNAL